MIWAALITAALALIGSLAGTFVSLRKIRSLKDDIYMNAINEVARQRLTPYGKLWEYTMVARPSDPSELTPESRKELKARMLRWYFDGGAGMLLSPQVRAQFSYVKDKLDNLEIPRKDMILAVSKLRSLMKVDIRALAEDPEEYLD